jgi:pimeloyl-ACP methyl ester carboxylesterase
VTGILLALPAAAPAKLAPFGHPCTLENGVFFCPTSSDSQRVKSFDGVPLDVDVTVPTHGLGHPFPTIVMLHGFPGSKESFESTTPNPAGNGLLYHYNNNFYAKRGYLVVNYSARGFARSCGVPDSRSSPGCDRGWFRLADQRWELRDAQELLSKLVDQGLTDPKRIGATGVSYGGGSSLQLAYLKNRIRTRNGDLVPWRSSSGKRLSIAAAYPRWGWSDLLYSLVPNGRFQDFDASPLSSSLSPIGIAKRSLIDALYLGGTAVGYQAPKGADPTADLGTWRDELYAGEPYGAGVGHAARQLWRYKSAVGIPGTPAPLLIMDGWTDPAFNAVEALRPYNRILENGKSFVALQLGDLGHFRAGNALEMYRHFADEGEEFFARNLKGTGVGPASGTFSGWVDAYGQGCPKGRLGPGPIFATSWSRLARGSFFLKHPQFRRISGGDEASGRFFDPVSNGDPCSTTAPTKSNGTAVVTRKSKGFTLAGLTTIRAFVENSDSSGQIDVRLFDVFDGKERLVDYGMYRLRPGQDGRIEFQLAGNLYRFAAGHTVRIELRGRNEPWFLADRHSRARVGGILAFLPTRDKPDSARDIGSKVAHPRD